MSGLLLTLHITLANPFPFHVSVLSGLHTCGDVKTLYQSSSCCGGDPATVLSSSMPMHADAKIYGRYDDNDYSYVCDSRFNASSVKDTMGVSLQTYINFSTPSPSHNAHLSTWVPPVIYDDFLFQSTRVKGYMVALNRTTLQEIWRVHLGNLLPLRPDMALKRRTPKSRVDYQYDADGRETPMVRSSPVVLNGFVHFTTTNLDGGTLALFKLDMRTGSPFEKGGGVYIYDEDERTRNTGFATSLVYHSGYFYIGLSTVYDYNQPGSDDINRVTSPRRMTQQGCVFIIDASDGVLVKRIFVGPEHRHAGDKVTADDLRTDPDTGDFLDIDSTGPYTTVWAFMDSDRDSFTPQKVTLSRQPTVTLPDGSTAGLFDLHPPTSSDVATSGTDFHALEDMLKEFMVYNVAGSQIASTWDGKVYIPKPAGFVPPHTSRIPTVVTDDYKNAEYATVSGVVPADIPSASDLGRPFTAWYQADTQGQTSYLLLTDIVDGEFWLTQVTSTGIGMSPDVGFFGAMRKYTKSTEFQNAYIAKAGINPYADSKMVFSASGVPLTLGLADDSYIFPMVPVSSAGNSYQAGAMPVDPLPAWTTAVPLAHPDGVDVGHGFVWKGATQLWRPFVTRVGGESTFTTAEGVSASRPDKRYAKTLRIGDTLTEQDAHGLNFYGGGVWQFSSGIVRENKFIFATGNGALAPLYHQMAIYSTTSTPMSTWKAYLAGKALHESNQTQTDQAAFRSAMSFYEAEARERVRVAHYHTSARGRRWLGIGLGAIDVRTHELSWHKSLTSDDYFMVGSLGENPQDFGESWYVTHPSDSDIVSPQYLDGDLISSSKAGTTFVLNASTGAIKQVIWSGPSGALGGGNFGLGKYGPNIIDSNSNWPTNIWQIYCRPDSRDTLGANKLQGGWMHENTDYFPHGTGFMYSLKKNAQTQKYEVVWAVKGTGFMPATANGVVVTLNPSEVRAHNVSNGVLLTKFSLTSVIGSAGEGEAQHDSELGPVIYDNVVYVSRTDGVAIQIGLLELGFKKKDESFARYVFTAAGAAQFTQWGVQGATPGVPFPAAVYAIASADDTSVTLAGIAELGWIEPDRNYVFTAAGAHQFTQWGVQGATPGVPFPAAVYAIASADDTSVTLAGIAELGWIEAFGTG